MADTALPSVATVNPEQLAAILEVYGDTAGYRKAMRNHILNDIKQHKQAEVQTDYHAALQAAEAQESAAMAQVDALLASLTT